MNISGAIVIAVIAIAFFIVAGKIFKMRTKGQSRSERIANYYADYDKRMDEFRK